MTASSEKPSRYRWLVIAYVGFIVVWLILRLMFFDRFLPVAVLNAFAKYLFVPAPILLVIGMWRREWRASLPLIVPIVIFVAWFGARLVPRSAPSAPDDAPAITAMSFNIWHRNADYTGLANSMWAADADIVGVQELSLRHSDSILAALGDTYPYHTFDAINQSGSVGLLSRHPIESIDYFDFPPRQYALHAIVDIEGQPLHIFVAHFTPNYFGDKPPSEYLSSLTNSFASRLSEATQLEARMAEIDDPIILLCDCNLTDTSEAWARLDGFLDDSYYELGWGFGITTYPLTSLLPGLPNRLDYIWHSDKIIATDTYIGQRGGSDHAPIIARLSITPQQ